MTAFGFSPTVVSKTFSVCHSPTGALYRSVLETELTTMTLPLRFLPLLNVPVL
ncbi:hypothetical protein [Clostridium gasigenes]|uniref:hypothetical protein n=1 Tax=Clostridium gasigenes TaxID=94869 RepID=UPI001C0AE22F|nr:hypothetical protein [Clostridium gasigenes]MBU3109810.1 hypothetical protein [Clostridium gasigenes]